MVAFNKVIIAGNLSRDIELRHLPNGTAVTDASLAINSQWTGKDGQKHEDVTFVDCTLWGKTAELASQYLKKGSAVLFEGSLKLESWDDKTSGQKRSKLKVNVDSMQFLGEKPASGGGGNRNDNRNDNRNGGGNGGNSDHPRQRYNR
jgi:single-strand DNA-binding protein